MGVTGFLPALKSIQDNTTLERYRGKTLAVDTYAWLHKAAFSCSLQLVTGKQTRAYINYVVRRLEMFRHFGITAYMVFDGDHMPSKAGTEKERREHRRENKQKALEALNRGDTRNAMNYAQKACDITPEMAKALIEELKKRQVRYIVAPYEADSQMVYLEQIGIVDGIVSEDSDLLVFGCQTLITKLNDKGQCIEVNKARFKECKNAALGCLDKHQLQLTAMISGCDYTKGIPGLGVLKAATLVKRYKNFERVQMAIKYEGKVTIPDNFEDDYKRARISFRHPVVFDPVDGKAKHLNPLPKDAEERYSREYILSCTGQLLEDDVHARIARGDLNPFTKEPLHSRGSDASSTGAGSFRSVALPMRKTQSAANVNVNPRNTLDKFAHTAGHMNSVPANTSPRRVRYVSRKRATVTIDQFYGRAMEKRMHVLDSDNSKGEASPHFKKKATAAVPTKPEPIDTTDDEEPPQIQEPRSDASHSSEFVLSDLDSPEKPLPKLQDTTAQHKEWIPAKFAMKMDTQSPSQPVVPRKRKPLGDITNRQRSDKTATQKPKWKFTALAPENRSIAQFRFNGSS